MYGLRLSTTHYMLSAGGIYIMYMQRSRAVPLLFKFSSPSFPLEEVRMEAEYHLKENVVSAAAAAAAPAEGVSVATASAAALPLPGAPIARVAPQVRRPGCFQWLRQCLLVYIKVE